MNSSFVTKCALLHDIGKICQRAGGGHKLTHAELGAEFLKPFLLDVEGKERLGARSLWQCVRYHHAADLSKAGLEKDNLAWLVYEADNIAAGTDRRPLGDDATGPSFDARQLLGNVFNVFSPEGGTQSFYRLQGLEARRAEEGFPQPVKNPLSASSASYQA